MLHGGVLSGFVYIDADGDGMRDDGEAGVPGVLMSLGGMDDGGAAVDRTTLTQSDGSYAFDDLNPGTYSISQSQPQPLFDGAESSTATSATMGNDQITAITLGDEQTIAGNNFGEGGLRPEYVSLRMFLASTPAPAALLRETIAKSEEAAGNTELAASIRAGATQPPAEEQPNRAPVGVADTYTVGEGGTLTVPAASGVLSNDTDADGDALTAQLVANVASGALSLNADGGFTFTPAADFSGMATFTYRANDGALTSAVTTVTINVTDTNQAPVAVANTYSTNENTPLTVNAASGVLANDTDADGNPLTAQLVANVASGALSLSADGSFTYTPNNGFSGTDTFTYRASDGSTTSNTVTVTITVVDIPANTLFGAVTTGSFQASGLLGVRTDLVPGAPAITANHVDGDIDYTGYSNPPTYGNHHGSDPNGSDVNPGITPRPTGIYTTEQPEEDLIHNLEHGHVWISYNPSLISSADRAALEQLVRDGSPNANGGGVGVILTPRAANDSMIALASWARLSKLDSYDPAAIRNFVETNRGKAPEGFITP